MKCPDCHLETNLGYMCDQDDSDPRCGTCFEKTPCGQGMHEEGCETQVFETTEEEPIEN